jgi:hypothetical protein
MRVIGNFLALFQHGRYRRQQSFLHKWLWDPLVVLNSHNLRQLNDSTLFRCLVLPINAESVVRPHAQPRRLRNANAVDPTPIRAAALHLRALASAYTLPTWTTVFADATSKMRSVSLENSRTYGSPLIHRSTDLWSTRYVLPTINQLIFAFRTPMMRQKLYLK